MLQSYYTFEQESRKSNTESSQKVTLCSILFPAMTNYKSSTKQGNWKMVLVSETPHFKYFLISLLQICLIPFLNYSNF